MSTICSICTPDELQEMLRLHRLWLLDDGGGIKINLRDANLGGANLWSADLRRADMRRANLRGANLGGANLWRAHLNGADLWSAHLWGANLGNADLRGADLRGAKLGGVRFDGANLEGAYLWRDDFDPYDRSINLRGANLGVPRAEWETIFPEAHSALMGILANGTITAKNRIRARLRFFRDFAAMKPPNLYAYATEHGLTITEPGRWRDYLQGCLGGIKLTQPAIRKGASWNEIELSPAGKALADWLALHPEHLAD